MDIKNIYGNVIYTSPDTTMKDTVVEAFSKGADLSGAYLSGAYLSGADLRGAYLSGAYLSDKKITTLRVFYGLYDYQVWAVLFDDASRWVRMGCLFYSLEDWEKIGIRKSNVNEFPDDGSDKCEERVAAFEFAKAATLRMKLPTTQDCGGNNGE